MGTASKDLVLAISSNVYNKGVIMFQMQVIYTKAKNTGGS